MRVSETHLVSIICRYNKSVDSSGQLQEAFCLKVRLHYPKSNEESQCIGYCSLSVNIYLIILSVLS